MKKFWQREDFWEKFWHRTRSEDRPSGPPGDWPWLIRNWRRLKILMWVILIGLFLNAMRIVITGDYPAESDGSEPFFDTNRMRK